MDSPSGTISQTFASDRETTERRSDAHLVALHEVFQAVAQQTDARLTLALIAEKARMLTGAATAAITLLDDSRRLLDFAAVAGANAAEILGQTVQAEDALAGRTALTGELYLSHNPAETRPLLSNLDPAAALGWGVSSAAVLPVYLHSRPAGALAAINREDGRAFSGADVMCLQVLANAAAVAIGIDDLRRQAAQKQRERDILYEAARTASSSLNVQEVLSGVLATLAGSLEMDAGAVFLLNDERTRLYIGADRGLTDDERERQMAADFGLAEKVLASGQPILIADTMQPERTPGYSLEDLPFAHLRSLLIAPMTARANSEGLILVGSRQPQAYTESDARLLAAVAGQAAIAFENAWLYEDVTRRAEESAAIYELSQAVGGTLQLDRVLHFVADSVPALLHVDRFALFLYNPRAGCLEIKVARNIRRETVQTMTPRPGEGIAGWVMEFETPTAVQDVAADHRNRSCPIDTEGVTSLVSVPLQSGDQVIGVLHAMSSRRRLFTVGEMELLYTIANQVGTAIANAQMYEEARQKSEELRKSVRRVARALGSSRDTQETGQVIAELAAELTGADRCVLYSLDNAGLPRARAAHNFRSALAGTWDLSGPENPTAWVARRGRSLVVEDWSRETRYALPSPPGRERAAAYLGVPLKLGKTVLGVLEVHRREPRRFTAEDIRALLTFASQASVGLQNALLVEQASRRLADLETLRDLGALPSSSLTGDALRLAALSRLALPLQASAALISLDGSPLFWESVPDCRAFLLAAQARAAEASAPVLDTEAALCFLAVPVSSGAFAFCRPLALGSFDAYDAQLVATAASLLRV